MSSSSYIVRHMSTHSGYSSTSNSPKRQAEDSSISLPSSAQASDNASPAHSQQEYVVPSPSLSIDFPLDTNVAPDPNALPSPTYLPGSANVYAGFDIAEAEDDSSSATLEKTTPPAPQTIEREADHVFSRSADTIDLHPETSPPTASFFTPSPTAAHPSTVVPTPLPSPSSNDPFLACVREVFNRLCIVPSSPTTSSAPAPFLTALSPLSAQSLVSPAPSLKSHASLTSDSTVILTEPCVQRAALLHYLSTHGILPDDQRVRDTLESIKRGPAYLNFAHFFDVLAGDFLLRKVIMDDLTIQDFPSFSAALQRIYDDVALDTSGEVATYIPQLASVNPDQFGMSVCTVDGQRFNAGEHDVHFCIQSCSKPVTYGAVLTQHGVRKVHKHIGREPSGRGFNERILNSEGLPHNPMINSGAIMSVSLFHASKPESERFELLMDLWRRLAANARVTFDNSTYLSERATADRNFSLAYMMREAHTFPEGTDLTETLELYFMQCSIELTTAMMSVVAATLANGGVNPLTNDVIFEPSVVRHVLSLMSSCGMYDASGEFAFTVGFPTKSGVSGVIMMVIPGRMGLCSWSPRLDKIGNSVRGVSFCQELMRRFNLHIYSDLTFKHKQPQCDMRGNTVQHLGSKLLRPHVRDTTQRGEDAGYQYLPPTTLPTIELCQLLFASIAIHDLSLLRQCIAQHASWSYLRDHNGHPPLHVACYVGNWRAVVMMLVGGVDVWARDGKGLYAVELAERLLVRLRAERDAREEREGEEVACGYNSSRQPQWRNNDTQRKASPPETYNFRGPLPEKRSPEFLFSQQSGNSQSDGDCGAVIDEWGIQVSIALIQLMRQYLTEQRKISTWLQSHSGGTTIQRHAAAIKSLHKIATESVLGRRDVQDAGDGEGEKEDLGDADTGTGASAGRHAPRTVFPSVYNYRGACADRAEVEDASAAVTSVMGMKSGNDRASRGLDRDADRERERTREMEREFSLGLAGRVVQAKLDVSVEVGDVLLPSINPYRVATNGKSSSHAADEKTSDSDCGGKGSIDAATHPHAPLRPSHHSQTHSRPSDPPVPAWVHPLMAAFDSEGLASIDALCLFDRLCESGYYDPSLPHCRDLLDAVVRHIDYYITPIACSSDVPAAGPHTRVMRSNGSATASGTHLDVNLMYPLHTSVSVLSTHTPHAYAAVAFPYNKAYRVVGAPRAHPLFTLPRTTSHGGQHTLRTYECVDMSAVDTTVSARIGLQSFVALLRENPILYAIAVGDLAIPDWETFRCNVWHMYNQVVCESVVLEQPALPLVAHADAVTHTHGVAPTAISHTQLGKQLDSSPVHGQMPRNAPSDTTTHSTIGVTEGRDDYATPLPTPETLLLTPPPTHSQARARLRALALPDTEDGIPGFGRALPPLPTPSHPHRVAVAAESLAAAGMGIGAGVGVGIGTGMGLSKITSSVPYIHPLSPSPYAHPASQLRVEHTGSGIRTPLLHAHSYHDLHAAQTQPHSASAGVGMGAGMARAAGAGSPETVSLWESDFRLESSSGIHGDGNFPPAAPPSLTSSAARVRVPQPNQTSPDDPPAPSCPATSGANSPLLAVPALASFLSTESFLDGKTHGYGYGYESELRERGHFAALDMGAGMGGGADGAYDYEDCSQLMLRRDHAPVPMPVHTPDAHAHGHGVVDVAAAEAIPHSGSGSGSGYISDANASTDHLSPLRHPHSHASAHLATLPPLPSPSPSHTPSHTHTHSTLASPSTLSTKTLGRNNTTSGSLLPSTLASPLPSSHAHTQSTPDAHTHADAGTGMHSPFATPPHGPAAHTHPTTSLPNPTASPYNIKLPGLSRPSPSPSPSSRLPSAAAPPAPPFTVSLCSVTSQQFSVGFPTHKFTVQSLCKIVNYCIAQQVWGESVVHEYIGKEPSGRELNELCLDYNNRPHNPYVNAGAIMCCALLLVPEHTMSERFNFILSFWRRLTCSNVTYNIPAYIHEKECSDRHYCLSFMMKDQRSFPHHIRTHRDVDTLLDLYALCASIEITAQQASLLAATLANGGVNPLTGDAVFQSKHVRNALSIMATSGVYNFSGEFAFHVGVPGKSSGAGTLLVCVPGVLGICATCPVLDDNGVSVLATRFCFRLCRAYALHVYESANRHTRTRVNPRCVRGWGVSRVLGLLQAVQAEDIFTVARMGTQGVCVRGRDGLRRSALLGAVKEGCSGVVAVLLRKGADVDATDVWGNSPDRLLTDCDGTPYIGSGDSEVYERTSEGSYVRKPEVEECVRLVRDERERRAREDRQKEAVATRW